jgi:hypothetical protein
MLVAMKVVVLCDMTSCGPVQMYHFPGKLSLFPQDRRLKMEAVSCDETSVCTKLYGFTS